MPNENSLKNLEKGKATRFKAGEKQAKIASLGGKASQRVQKEKRDARAYAKMVLDLKPKMPDVVARNMKEIGITEKKPDARLIAMCAQMRKAMAGDQKALEFLLGLTGELDGAPEQESYAGDLDEQNVRQKLDGMTDEQLMGYQEICTMFGESDEEGGSEG